MTGEPTPKTADVVVVGGGILGLSIAWHLARTCAGSIVVADRLPPATQATSRAAALLTLGREDDRVIPLIQSSYRAIAMLGEVLDDPLPLHRNGTVYVATSESSRRELQDLMLASTGKAVNFQTLDSDDAGKLVPWLAVEADAACAYCPDDAFIDPYLLAAAYADAARRSGATIIPGLGVASLILAGGKVAGVTTAAGEIAAPIVVVAAGLWSNLLSASCGAGLPMAPVRSQYWITASDDRFPPGHPSVLLPDASAYTRPEMGALLFGVRERRSISVDPRDLPDDVSGYAFADDPGGLASLEESSAALHRFAPALADVGIRTYVAGFSTYTPDGLPVFGAAPGIDGLLFAGGCSGAGIAISGGVGEAVAALALGQRPEIDIDAFRVDRFGTVDPFDPAFRARCAAARSRKREG